jgi:hypothetical protein
MVDVEDETNQPVAAVPPNELETVAEEEEEKKSEAPSEIEATTAAADDDDNDKKDDDEIAATTPAATVTTTKKEKKEIVTDDTTDYSNWPYKNIKEPHDNDVLYGRGGTCSSTEKSSSFLLPSLSSMVGFWFFTHFRAFVGFLFFCLGLNNDAMQYVNKNYNM